MYVSGCNCGAQPEWPKNITWELHPQHSLSLQASRLLQAATVMHNLSGPARLSLGNYTHSTASLASLMPVAGCNCVAQPEWPINFVTWDYTHGTASLCKPHACCTLQL